MDIDEDSNQSAIESNSIVAQISTGELVLSKKKGRSRVWEVFAEIVDTNGVANKNYSNSKVEIDEATKKNVTKLITKWVIKNCRPYNMVKDDGLHEVLQEFALIGAKHGANIDVEKALPHPTTISRNVADIYEECFKNVKGKIASIKENGYGLTADIWTDDYLKKSYIALTMHFLKNGTLSIRSLGMKSMEGERCTSENVFRKMQKLLNEFGCDFSCKSIIVTDRGADMKKAFRNTQHLACVCHLLNNTLQKSVEEVTEVAELSNCCAKLVKYFKKSGLNASLSHSLKSYCPTRWNTVFHMLSSIEKNWGEINHILQSKNEFHRIESININFLKAVTKTLEPFEEAIKTLEGENYPTLHLVLIYLHQLNIACEANGSDLDLVQSFKEKLRCNLNIIVMQNITIFHKIALFLYPPTNKLLQCSEAEKQHIEGECLRLLKNFQNEIQVQEAPSTSTAVSKHKELFLDFVEPETNLDSNECICRELQLYKSTRVLTSADFNVFTWWEMQKQNFPFLYKLSCIILATPASSASSERIFSAAKNLLSDKRSSMGINEVGINQVMFIHSNVDKNELNSKF